MQYWQRHLKRVGLAILALLIVVGLIGLYNLQYRYFPTYTRITNCVMYLGYGCLWGGEPAYDKKFYQRCIEIVRQDKELKRIFPELGRGLTEEECMELAKAK